MTNDKNSGADKIVGSSDVLARERDLLRLLAIALHKLGGKMEITPGDYFAVQNKTFFSTRDQRGMETICLADDKPATAFAVANYISTPKKLPK